MSRIYKEANKSETETTINVLYGEKVIVLYTNNVPLQKELLKAIGKPQEEHFKGRSIVSSVWKIKFSEKSKITKMMTKANIFEL